MPNAHRTIIKFDPREELRSRYPEWRLQVSPIQSGEIWLPADRLILVQDGDQVDRILTHICAHLALDHHEGTTLAFSSEQEQEADDLAAVYLDEWRL